MSQVKKTERLKEARRFLAAHPEMKRLIKKLAEGCFEILDSEERFLRQYPKYLEKIRKEEESQKRDPLADAW